MTRRVSLVSLVKGRRGPSGFGYASTAEEVTRGLDLRGRRILVTGVNSGLGAETARVLATRGAKILGTARTADKAEGACAGLPNDAVPLVCELSEPASVAACAEAAAQAGPIDALILNAGVMALPERVVKHGHELQFLTNHLGHFILATRLLDALTDDARVVVLSSSAHRRAPSEGIRFDDPSFADGSYSPWTSYGQSKLANALFARALASRFEGTGRTANAVPPGVIATNLGRHLPGPARLLAPLASAIAMKSVPEGAATQCYVATHPSLADVSGRYFADCNLAKPSRHARDDAMAGRLWELSEAFAADHLGGG